MGMMKDCMFNHFDVGQQLSTGQSGCLDGMCMTYVRTGLPNEAYALRRTAKA